MIIGPFGHRRIRQFRVHIWQRYQRQRNQSGTILVRGSGGETAFNGHNNNVIQIATGGTLRIGGSTFSNSGSILVQDGGILNLDQPLTPWNLTGVYRSGLRSRQHRWQLHNAGQTLELSSTPIGQVGLGGGANITGGTLSSSTGDPVLVNRGSVTLNNAAVNADLAIENGATLIVSRWIAVVRIALGHGLPPGWPCRTGGRTTAALAPVAANFIAAIRATR